MSGWTRQLPPDESRDPRALPRRVDPEGSKTENLTFSRDARAETVTQHFEVLSSSMSSSRGRKTACFAAAGVVASVAACFAFWNDLAVLYHLNRLRTDPEHFSEIAEAPAGSSRRDALERWFATEEGRQQVLSACVSDTDILLESWKNRRTGAGKALLILEPKASGLTYRLGHTREPVGDSAQARRSSVLRLVRLLDGERFAVPERPGLAFTVFTDGENAYREYLGEREWEDLKRFARVWSGRSEPEDDGSDGLFLVVECLPQE